MSATLKTSQQLLRLGAKALLPALLSGLTLSACQSSGVGEGPPPTFSRSVQAYFEQYQNEKDPIVFVVSTDGRYAVYYYCTDLADVCVGTVGATYQARMDCESGSGGVPCKVYALRRTIKWTGPDEVLVAEEKSNNHSEKLVETPQWSRLCQEAKLGDETAMAAIAIQYRYGWSPAKLDLVQSYKWYTLAIKAGYSSGESVRKAVADSLSPHQIAEAEKLVADWELHPTSCY